MKELLVEGSTRDQVLEITGFMAADRRALYRPDCSGSGSQSCGPTEAQLAKAVSCSVRFTIAFQLDPRAVTSLRRRICWMSFALGVELLLVAAIVTRNRLCCNETVHAPQNCR